MHNRTKLLKFHCHFWEFNQQGSGDISTLTYVTLPNCKVIILPAYSLSADTLPVEQTSHCLKTWSCDQLLQNYKIYKSFFIYFSDVTVCKSN